MNGSAELRMVEVALVLGEEEGHEFQYLPGESNDTVWPGSYKLICCDKNNTSVVD